jgi:hypothetical protein
MRPFSDLVSEPIAKLWRKSSRSSIQKVAAGKDGILFLHNDTNQVMKQITGEMRASQEQLAGIGGAHQRRTAYCSEIGIDYRHVICPNKESVLVEQLPDAFVYEQYGPTFLRQYLEASPDTPCFYDRDLLKNRKDAYFQTDSHWTELGSVPYLEAALEHYGAIRELRRLRDLAPVPVPVQHQGDLGRALGKPPELAFGLHIPSVSASLLFDGSAVAGGNIRFQRSPEPSNAGTKALVLHDSFTHFLYRFICELYEETLFINMPDLDLRFLRHYKPDVLWFFQAERFLPRIPRNDIDFLTSISDSERRKRLPPRSSEFMRANWPAAFD